MAETRGQSSSSGALSGALRRWSAPVEEEASLRSEGQDEQKVSSATIGDAKGEDSVVASVDMLAEICKRMDTYEAELESTRKKQQQIMQKQEESEDKRRGQLDCISERVFQVEKNMRLAENSMNQSKEFQEEAIEKASATFQKHSQDVEQERQNLVCVISQVNQNFEQLSLEIAQHGQSMEAMEQTVLQMQGTVSQSAGEVRALSHDFASLEHSQLNMGEMQMMDHTVQQQKQEIRDLQMGLQSIREAVMRMTQAEARQVDLAEEISEVRNLFDNSQAEQQLFAAQLSDAQGRIASLMEEVGKTSQQNPPRGGERYSADFTSATARGPLGQSPSPPLSALGDPQEGGWIPLPRQFSGHRGPTSNNGTLPPPAHSSSQPERSGGRGSRESACEAAVAAARARTMELSHRNDGGGISVDNLESDVPLERAPMNARIMGGRWLDGYDVFPDAADGEEPDTNASSRPMPYGTADMPLPSLLNFNSIPSSRGNGLRYT